MAQNYLESKPSVKELLVSMDFKTSEQETQLAEKIIIFGFACDVVLI